MTTVVVELAQTASRAFHSLWLTFFAQIAGDGLAIEGNDRCHC